MQLENPEISKSTQKPARLVLAAMPVKTIYKPGDRIDLSGVKVTVNGQDVTDKASFDYGLDDTWRSGEKSRVVNVSVDTATGTLSTSFELHAKKKPVAVIILACLLIIAVAAVAGFIAADMSKPKPEDGSYLIPQGNMTKEEAKNLVNEQAAKSRIDVNIAQKPALKSDGTLRINFIVAEPNNGLSERLEIEQEGKLVYKSDIVKPGYFKEWVTAPDVKIGPATITVYAVDENGNDSGNPVAVDVEIVQDYKEAAGQ